MAGPENNTQKILIIAVSGIGNTILQSPLIRRMLNERRFHCDILFGNATMAAVFRDETRFANVHILPQGSAGKLSLVKTLRRSRYDISVACFPSNRYEFHLLPSLIGARQRIIHAYPAARRRTLSFFSTTGVPTDQDLHDVEQNLNLLLPLGIDPRQVPRDLHFAVGPENRRFAEKFRQRHNLTAPLLGIHPGSKGDQKYKRWPADKFAELIDRLNGRGIPCLLFAGPEDKDIVMTIHNKLKAKERNIVVEEKDINNVGALIGLCQGFLSSESGLGHIAAAVGVETFALFGPTNRTRTAPYGPRGHCIALPPEYCCRRFRYPFYATSSRFRCPFDFRCLKDIPVDLVDKELNKNLRPD